MLKDFEWGRMDHLAAIEAARVVDFLP